MPFRGERFALILFSLGTTMYLKTPGVMQALSSELGFQLPKPCYTVPDEEDHEIARQILSGEEIVPGIVPLQPHSQNLNSPLQTSHEASKAPHTWKPALPASRADGEEELLESTVSQHEPLEDQAENRVEDNDDAPPLVEPSDSEEEKEK